jgi:hypothetical protein
VAFVDISGFTGLSEHLINQHGAHGAEILNVIISGYFNKLIDVIVDFGGESVHTHAACKCNNPRTDAIHRTALAFAHGLICIVCALA